jgi:hypothetical protein
MRKFVSRSNRTLRLAAVVIAAGSIASAASVREIDCSKDSLREAVASSAAGDTLRISGTCRESITITVDRLILDGHGMAIVDGGLPGGGNFAPNGGAFNAMILIEGARGVTIRGLTIINGPGGGLIGRSNASFRVEMTAIRRCFFGLVVQGSSHADIAYSEITGNTDAGMGVADTSSVVIIGSLDVTGNLEGISGGGHCDLALLGAQLNVSGNRNNGISLSGCSLSVRNFGMQSTIKANENGMDGLFIGGGQLVIGESFFFGFAGEIFHPIVAAKNGGSGINLPGFASIVNLGGAKFDLHENATGLSLGSESSILMIGGLRAENNGAGILADGAGTLTLVSTPRNPSVIKNNTTDVELRFGTRMTVSGADVGTLKCDGTSLSRGSLRCP